MNEVLAAAKSDQGSGDDAFVLEALMEIPAQYKYCRDNRLKKLIQVKRLGRAVSDPKDRAVVAGMLILLPPVFPTDLSWGLHNVALVLLCDTLQLPLHPRQCPNPPLRAHIGVLFRLRP